MRKAGKEQAMVRISDLVRGRTPPPAAKSDGRTEPIRLSKISELGSVETTAASPETLPVNPPEQQPLPGAPPGQLPEQGVSPLSNNRHTPGGRDIYLSAQDYLRELKEGLFSGKQITLDRPLSMIDRMIAEPSLIHEMYLLTLAFEHSGDIYLVSPINSMIYSFKIGMRMGYAPPMLTEVCLAALHHDIGMFLISESITKKDGKLTESEYAAMKRHTETGRDLFVALGYPNVGRAIHEHHERENGQGYPSGLKGNEICEYAKIIGICDSYEAMTHDRPHKKAAAQYVSVLKLAGSKDLLFPPHIVKMFLDEITLYPIGSYVRLNNQAVGVVVETNTGNPMKPTIRITVDGHGKKILEEKLINLADNSILTIAAGVSPDELPA